MKASLSAALAVALGAVTFTAYAQVKPDVLVKQRQAKMTLQGKYFGTVAGMASGKVTPYDPDAVARAAAHLESLSQMAWDGFHESTKSEKSRLLPAAFTQKAKFDDYARRLEAEASKLAQSAKAKDQAGVKQHVGEVLKTCNGCHDDFRSK